MSAIRSVWDEPRPADVPARAGWDWALVGVFVAAAVIEGIARPDVPGRWLQVATVVLLAPTLLWRRTYPLLMVAVAFVVSGVPAVLLGRELDLGGAVFMLVLAYALFRWGSGRAMVLGTAVVLAKMGTNAALGFLTLADVGIGCLILGSTFALGLALRYRSGARRREREQVVLLERERLARDLHDVVGHRRGSGTRGRARRPRRGSPDRPRRRSSSGSRGRRSRPPWPGSARRPAPSPARSPSGTARTPGPA